MSQRTYKSCEFFVYIMGSASGVLYVGVTNDLERRVGEHKAGETKGFTSRYRVRRLLYFEEFTNPSDAIDREKEIKGWLRRKKLALIRTTNPKLLDLSAAETD